MRDLKHAPGLFVKHIGENPSRFKTATISSPRYGETIIFFHTALDFLSDSANERLLSWVAEHAVQLRKAYWRHQNMMRAFSGLSEALKNAITGGAPKPLPTEIPELLNGTFVTAWEAPNGALCALICPAAWANEHFPWLSGEDDDATS